MTRSLFLCNNADRLATVYTAAQRDHLSAITDMYPQALSAAELPEHVEAIRDVEVVFSTWGMPRLSETELALLPSLKAVFYAAGSVKGFAGPLLDRGITVVSAWAANGVPVAEFTLAQILLANKWYFQNTTAYRSPEARQQREEPPGNYGETVALLGMGVIGRQVARLLRPFELKIVAWDPFMDEQRAQELGVAKVESLDEAFSRGLVVSNHLANVPETVGLLKAEHFRAMRPQATFINTGRGATVVEPDLIDAMRDRPDLTALLDVTHPEPPGAGSPLFELPNIHLSTHIAGSTGDERSRLAAYAIEEFEAWERGDPLRYAVTPGMLATMA